MNVDLEDRRASSYKIRARAEEQLEDGSGKTETPDKNCGQSGAGTVNRPQANVAQKNESYK